MLKTFSAFSVTAFIALFSIACSGNALATILPERENTEVHFIPDYPVDQDVKLAKIRQAKHSVDFVTFSQTDDVVGTQFLKAIRFAQKNGAKVRVIYDRYLSALEGDLIDDVRMIVTDSELSCPGEVSCPHPIKKTANGLELNDYIHEKILIIDYGTPDEIVFIGGRGFTKTSSYYLDSAYSIRPLNHLLPYLGDDVKNIFERLWRYSRQLNYVSGTGYYNWTKPTKIDAIPNAQFAKTPKAKKWVADLLASLSLPADRPLDASGPAGPYRMLPKKIGLISNDLYHQLISNKADTRPILKNDIVDSVVRDLDQASGVFEMTSYSFGPTQKLLKAIARFVNRGNTFVLYSNGPRGFAEALPVKTEAPFYYTAERLMDLYALTKGTKGSIRVFLQNVDKTRKFGANLYVHRKLALFHGNTPGSKITYVGSDNLTWSSANRNDEIMARFNDDAFTDFHMNLNRSDLKFFDEFKRAQIEKMHRDRPALYRIGRGLIRDVF